MVLGGPGRFGNTSIFEMMSEGVKWCQDHTIDNVVGGDAIGAGCGAFKGGFAGAAIWGGGTSCVIAWDLWL